VLAVEEYEQRLKDRESAVARHEQIHIRLGYVRLLLALVEAGLAWESLWRHALSPWWMVGPLIVLAESSRYQKYQPRSAAVNKQRQRPETQVCSLLLTTVLPFDPYLRTDPS
jgi:hypothetical protein